MDDLISRQAAIDALGEDALWDSDDEYETGMHTQWSMDVDAIKALPSVQPDYKDGWIYTGKKAWEFEPCEDTISRQAAIDMGVSIPMFGRDVKMVAVSEIKNLPSVQPERTCVNCGRTANNGGWYADGRTRCPIEEHYALPKDGYCHLWEKRNVTDDNYPERREE